MQRRKHEFKGIHCRDCPFWRPPTRCLDRALKSGRCGDWIWYLRGRKQPRRPYVRPKDPHTLAQMEYRGRLSAASSIYSQYLTEEERHACIAAGAKLQSRRRLGQSGPLTGQQYWIRKDSKRLKPQSKATKLKNAAQLPLPQGGLQCSSDPHRGASRVPPEQHHVSTGTATGPVLGSRPEMTVEVPHLQEVIPSVSDNRYIPLSRPAATLSPPGGERAGRGGRGN